MRASENRERRAIRIGLLVSVPVLLGRCAIQPYLGSLDGERNRLAEERSLLAHETALVDARKALAALANSTAIAVAIRSPYLFQSDSTLAGSALVGYVAKLVSSDRMQLQAADARGTEEVGAGPVRAVQVDVRAAGDIAGVLAFLRDLETGPKLVHIDRLTLEPAKSAAAKGVRLLSLTATMSGYTLPGPMYTGEERSQ